MSAGVWKKPGDGDRGGGGKMGRECETETEVKTEIMFGYFFYM